MIDLGTETIVTFREALKHPMVRRRDGRPTTHVGKLHKWANCGVRGVKLETVLIGGIVATSQEALERFFQRINATRQSCRDAAEMPRTPAKRRRENERAGELCAAAGF
jgi:hypothetical protein